MGDNNLHLADLLLKMQRELSDDIANAKDDLSIEIRDVKEAQAAQGNELAQQSRDLTAVKSQQASHGVEIRDLRRLVETRTTGLGLTTTQKRALWTIATGAAGAGWAAIKGWLFTALYAVKGVPRL